MYRSCRLYSSRLCSRFADVQSRERRSQSLTHTPLVADASAAARARCLMQLGRTVDRSCVDAGRFHSREGLVQWTDSFNGVIHRSPFAEYNTELRGVLKNMRILVEAGGPGQGDNTSNSGKRSGAASAGRSRDEPRRSSRSMRSEFDYLEVHAYVPSLLAFSDSRQCGRSRGIAITG